MLKEKIEDIMVIMDHDSARRSRIGGRSALAGEIPEKEDGRSDVHFEGFIVHRKTGIIKRTLISNCLHFSFYINKLCDSPI